MRAKVVHRLKLMLDLKLELKSVQMLKMKMAQKVELMMDLT
jgi:hypothetical protein